MLLGIGAKVFWGEIIYFLNVYFSCNDRKFNNCIPFFCNKYPLISYEEIINFVKCNIYWKVDWNILMYSLCSVE